jgi:hypothetical protein
MEVGRRKKEEPSLKIKGILKPISHSLFPHSYSLSPK